MKKILMIEDEFCMVNLIKPYLEEKEYQVFWALSGKEGIKKAARIKPDIITLDIIMPGMNGFEVIKQLKSSSETADIPVVMLTSSINEMYKERSFMLGAVDYLDKSFSEEIIIREIEKHLKQKES